MTPQGSSEVSLIFKMRWQGEPLLGGYVRIRSRNVTKWIWTLFKARVVIFLGASP